MAQAKGKRFRDTFFSLFCILDMSHKVAKDKIKLKTYHKNSFNV